MVAGSLQHSDLCLSSYGLLLPASKCSFLSHLLSKFSWDVRPTYVTNYICKNCAFLDKVTFWASRWKDTILGGHYSTQFNTFAIQQFYWNHPLCLLCKSDIGLLFSLYLQIWYYNLAVGGAGGRASQPGPGVLAQPVAFPVAEPSCTPGGTGQCPNTLPPVRDSVALYRGKPSSKIHCHGVLSPLYPVSHDCTTEEAPNNQVDKMTSVYGSWSLTPVIPVHAPKLVWAQKYTPYLLKTDLASIILLSV